MGCQDGSVWDCCPGFLRGRLFLEIIWEPGIGVGKSKGRNNCRDGTVCSTLMKACGKERK